jgi:hypothetical protein
LQLACLRLSEAIMNTRKFSASQHEKGERCWLDKM